MFGNRSSRSSGRAGKPQPRHGVLVLQGSLGRARRTAESRLRRAFAALRSHRLTSGPAFNPFTNKPIPSSWRVSLALGHPRKDRAWVLQQHREEDLGVLCVTLDSSSTTHPHGPDEVKCKAGKRGPSQTSWKPAGTGDFSKRQA